MGTRDKRYLTWCESKPVLSKDKKCSHSGCESQKLRITPSGVFCEEHYIGLPECVWSNCSEPSLVDTDGIPVGLCQLHSGLKFSLTAYRNIQWNNSEPLRCKVFLDEDGKGQTVTCSIKYCQTHHGLKRTPSGDFCQDHYLNGECCTYPGCLEPAASVDQNGKHRCRNHIGYFVDEQQEASDARSMSPIAADEAKLLKM